MSLYEKEIVVVRVFGQNVAVGVGKRTPDGPWYEAIVIDSTIDPNDAQRIGEETIRRALIRQAKTERQARASNEPLALNAGSDEGGG